MQNSKIRDEEAGKAIVGQSAVQDAMEMQEKGIGPNCAIFLPRWVFTGDWSMPIINAEGKVLGTFGTYFRTKREPSPAEITAIKLLAGTAARIVC